MLTLKLVRLIEKHSKELVGVLTEQVHLSERTSAFERFRPQNWNWQRQRSIATWVNGCCKRPMEISRVDFAQSAHVGRPRGSACISLCGP